MRRVAPGPILLVALGVFCLGSEAAAQVDRIKRATKREVEKKAEDAAVGAVKCALGDTACVEKAEKEGKPVVMTGEDGKAPTGDSRNQARGAGETGRPGQGVWRNYDFVPGDTVWRATDFRGEPVGRFPASQLEFVRGNMQIVEDQGENALEVSSNSVLRLTLPRALPDQFSFEFDIKIPTANLGTHVYFSPLEGAIARYEHDYVYIYARPGIYRKGVDVSNIYIPDLPQHWAPVKLQVDGAYAILYVGSERAAQVPKAAFARSPTIEIHASANSRFRTYLKNFVVAVGLSDLYDVLSTTGEYTTLGVLYDADSDRIRPESTPVLEAIAAMLKKHPELTIRIEGHTDSQGETEYNQDLSERRARSVVQYLTEQGIDSGRLTSAGKGESAPVGDNDTTEGRRQNRRVVVLKT